MIKFVLAFYLTTLLTLNVFARVDGKAGCELKMPSNYSKSDPPPGERPLQLSMRIQILFLQEIDDVAGHYSIHLE